MPGGSCSSCQQVQKSPESAMLHPWIWPSNPWVRIHLDFAGPFQGKIFLIAVDAFSKWPEIVEMTSTTAGQTVKVLRDIFARHGLPEQLVSDNGPQFVSSDFADFCKNNAIKHIRVSPYHPGTVCAAQAKQKQHHDEHSVCSTSKTETTS